MLRVKARGLAMPIRCRLICTPGHLPLPHSLCDSHSWYPLYREDTYSLGYVYCLFALTELCFSSRSLCNSFPYILYVITQLSLHQGSVFFPTALIFPHNHFGLLPVTAFLRMQILPLQGLPSLFTVTLCTEQYLPHVRQ